MRVIEPKNGEVYRHVASRNTYVILSACARLEWNMDHVVVYQDLVNGKTWVRPYHQFVDGRFERVPT